VAFKGNIRDFGVADIVQLIGQQAKTGVLVLSNDVDQVRVYFREGAVVRAENVTRPEDMLFGNLMVRARVISAEQLDRALESQQRSLKRLGSVLIDLGFAKSAHVKEFATLQTTETIYKLFEWNDGHYEFENAKVEPSPDGIAPLRSETIVMNGVRMMDEWPTLREQIPSYSWEVIRLKELPRPVSSQDLGGDSDVGPHERTVFALTALRRSVQRIIDESRLGEFEACRALGTLINHGYVKVTKPTPRSGNLGPPPVTLGQRVARGLGIAARVAVASGLMVVLAGLGRLAWVGAEPIRGLRPAAVERHLSVPQMRVLRRSLEVYRLSFGSYPEDLQALVDARLVRDRDLRFPFQNPYHYARTPDGYVLLPPVR
jgi:hypothetical protein